MQKMDLSGRPRTREELAGWYSAVLEDQASSGLSIAEYADELGVTATTLYQWRRRLGPQDAGEPDLPRPFGLVEMVARDHATTGGGESGFVVRLGCDRRIEVPREFDDADLRRIVTVLESC